MRSRDVRVSLWDAIEAGERIVEFLGSRTLEGYRRDSLLKSAVERKLEVVGEALNRAVQADASLELRVPQLRVVIGLRNAIAHGYDVVDDETVYRNATVDLPRLLATLRVVWEECGA